MRELSIIIPTCNRASLLERCLAAVMDGIQCDYEIVLIDGASTDNTQQVLVEAQMDLGDKLRVIREEERGGFVKAANTGFRAAGGAHLMWLNDDARPHPGAIDSALQQLKSAGPGVGMVALFHAFKGVRNVAYETLHDDRTYRLLHVRGTLYANFGIASAETFRELEYFDERYYLNAADPDFSLEVWNSGRQVIPAYGALIDHDEHEDIRRDSDADRGRIDNERLFAKWNLPPRNQTHNDFDPARPCTLAGLNPQCAQAA